MFCLFYRNVNYNLGFYQSPINYAQNALIGKIIPGFGFGSRKGFQGDYATSLMDSLGYGSSKDSQVLIELIEKELQFL